MEQLNLAQLLRIPFQSLVIDLHERLAEMGYADIRPTHTIIFALVGSDGMRLGELAERAQMTKQLVNYLVTSIEEMGYVERVADLEDGRAKIVRLTKRGYQASQAGKKIIQSIEQAWADKLGVQDMQELRSLLEGLVSVVV